MLRPLLRRHRPLLFAAAGLLALPGLAPLAQARQQVRAAPVPFPPQGPAAAAAPVARDSYSPQLRIYYQLEPYGRAYGARLTQPPLPGSPVGQPQIQLEAGDMIVGLDDIAITSPQELETHVAQTKVTFVNVRTGVREARWATLPGTANPGPYPPPGPGPYPPPYPPNPGPGGYTLGIMATPVILPPGFPGGRRRGLQLNSITPGGAAANAGLRPGEYLVAAGGFDTPDLNALRVAIDRSGGVLNMTIVSPWGQFRHATAYLGGAAMAPPGVAVPFGAPAPR
jgi:hypothetical protein